MPYTAMTVGSNRFQYDTAVTGSGVRTALKYFTHAIIELGCNDISGGASLSTVQNYLIAMCNEIKSYIGPYGKSIHIAVMKISPRADSTNLYVDLAGQTPRTPFTPGGIRDQYNTWLDTQKGVLFEDLIDPNPYWESSPGSGLWVVNGTANYPTTDGTHPRGALHIAAAQAVNTWAQTLSI